MAKRGRKPKAQPVASVTLSRWDMGATGPANRIGLQQEDAVDMDPMTGKPQPNPNGVKRMRRVDMLELWHRQRTITTAGFNAAERLRDAHEATQRGPGWADNDRVQSSPKPDVAVAMHIDRVSAYVALSKHIAPGDRRIIDVCVLDRGTPAKAGYERARYAEGLAHLRAALDRLANAMDA